MYNICLQNVIGMKNKVAENDTPALHESVHECHSLLCCPRLSGESPFQGNSDAETLSLVTAARYEFDQESFEDISDHAKDFISSLLKKDRRLVLFSFTPPSLNDCCKSWKLVA